VFLYSVHEPYGGPDGLRALVDAAHAHGLGVILDVVYNHLGPTGNVLPLFGPYLTDRHRTPWGDAVNFDAPGSTEVRRFVIDNLWHWVERYHVDGFRLDATHAIIDDSSRHILDELAAEMAEASVRAGRRIWTVAEHEDVDERLVRHPDHGGAGMDAVWNDPVHHALHALLTGERDGYYKPWGSLADLARVLAERAVRRHDGLAPERFVVFDQNHDQVGNRAAGERLGHLVGPELAMMAAALTLLAPGVPMLFMGEEWGASTPFPYFCGERSPDLDEAVRRGRREEFAAFCWDDVPDPVAIETAESARLIWSERGGGDHVRMLRWYTRMIELRRQLAGSGGATTLVTFDEEDRWLSMTRGALAVVVNLSERTQSVPHTAGEGCSVLAASSPADLQGAAVQLAPASVAVIGAG
jgi:maltooligosyltrehalose trehalohydrolase